ncbi:tetratricopeptide repeat protein [Elusimicrobiota bacterium]
MKHFLNKLLFFVVILMSLSLNLNAMMPNAYLAYLRGLLAAQDGDLRTAISEYKYVIENDENAVSVYRDLTYAYWRAGDRYKALETAEKLEKLDSKNIYTHLFLGSFYLINGQTDKARNAWESVLKIDPDNENAILYLAAYFSSDDQPGKAIKYWDKYIRHKPESAEGYYQKGVALERLGKHDEALKSFEKTIFLEPESYEAYFSLAQLYEKLDKIDIAIKQYEKCLDFAPDNTTILLYIGGLHYKIKNYSKAEKYFLKAYKADMNDDSIVFWLGVLAEERKDWDKAIKYFEILKEKEETGRLLARLSYYYSSKGKHIKAIECLKKAAKLEPENPTFFYLLGLAYYDVKKYFKAETNFKIALKLDPKLSDVSFHLAIMYDKWGRFDMAAKQLEEMILEDPKNAKALNYLGYSYADKNIQIEKARKYIEKALEIDPQNPAYIDSYGWVLYRQEEYTMAEKELEKAAKMLYDATIWGHLADVRAKMGRKSKAWIAYKKAGELEPKNKLMRKKIKLFEKTMTERDFQKSVLEKIIDDSKNIKSLRSTFILSGQSNSYNFQFQGQMKYQKPHKWRVDIVGGITSPGMTMIYNKKLKVIPQAVSENIPEALKSFFKNSDAFSLKDFQSEEVEVRKKGGSFVYELGKRKLVIDRKKSLLKECVLTNGTRVRFSKNKFVQFTYLPTMLEFATQGEISGKLNLRKYTINQALDQEIFLKP